MKTHKSILMQRSSVEFFRGVNFHVAVLSHAEQIMKMIPTFVKEGSLTKLDTIEDSVRLGNFMILTKHVISV
jgi:hypothetical protein